MIAVAVILITQSICSAAWLSFSPQGPLERVWRWGTNLGESRCD
ncbi:DUF418 domain-containing protein [Corynebacterium diphtheriae]